MEGEGKVVRQSIRKEEERRRLEGEGKVFKYSPKFHPHYTTFEGRRLWGMGLASKSFNHVCVKIKNG